MVGSYSHLSDIEKPARKISLPTKQGWGLVHPVAVIENCLFTVEHIVHVMGPFPCAVVRGSGLDASSSRLCS